MHINFLLCGHSNPIVDSCEMQTFMELKMIGTLGISTTTLSSKHGCQVFLLWPWMSHTYFDTFWPTSPCFWFCLFLILHILCYPPHKKSSRHPVLVLKRTHLELQYNISTEFRISKTTLICLCKLALMYLMFFVFYAKWIIIFLWPTQTLSKKGIWHSCFKVTFECRLFTASLFDWRRKFLFSLLMF